MSSPGPKPRVNWSFPADQSHRAENLLLWRHSIPDVSTNAVHPGFYSDLPNPAVVGERVIASVCLPGRVYAVDRTTGEYCWQVELPSYGGAAVYEAAGTLFAADTSALFALDPAMGEVRWTADLYDWNGQSVYVDGVVVCGAGKLAPPRTGRRDGSGALADRDFLGRR